MNQVEIKRIRLSPEIHRIAKIASANERIGLQRWIENVILKELKQERIVTF